MANPSILTMNRTLDELEHIRAISESRLPNMRAGERFHYWHIERKSKSKRKNARRWIFVAEFSGTKKEAADHFCKHFRNRPPFTYRLKHELAY